jgi:hypothetical protein
MHACCGWLLLLLVMGMQGGAVHGRQSAGLLQVQQ